MAVVKDIMMVGGGGYCCVAARRLVGRAIEVVSVFRQDLSPLPESPVTGEDTEKDYEDNLVLPLNFAKTVLD